MLILKYWAIIDILDGRDARNNSLAVMSDFFGELVVLEVSHCDMRHFLQHCWQKLLSFDLIVGNIQGANARTLQQAQHVL